MQINIKAFIDDVQYSTKCKLQENCLCKLKINHNL